ncbi:MAG: hypothetical protein CME88_05965 [Hirschia sp.]|nr:hypothetical protein [Hirschia sp.]MBF17910.1 hypothetical protein [Hirschia sp.]
MTLPTKNDVYALYRQDFPSFVRKAFAILQSGRELQDNWSIDAICWTLTEVMTGKVRRQTIEVPPRSLKSFITSIAFPAFVLGHHPDKRIMCVSHSSGLATELSRLFRDLVTSEDYRAIFPNVEIVKDTETDAVTAKGGMRKGVSALANITGMGADLLVLDDPIDGSDALNEEACSKRNEWIDSVLSTRLNDPSTTPIILVMQRLSIFDTVAHLIGQEPWSRLTLPAIAPKDIEATIGGGQIHLFRKGELLHPERYTHAFLETQKNKMGHRAFSAQYLQDPLSGTGGLVDLSKFNRWKKAPKLSDADFISVDPASGSQSGSYSVILKCRISDGRLYILALWRERATLPKLLKKVLSSHVKFNYKFLVIERTSNGIALIETLDAYFKEKTNDIAHWRELIQPITPTKSKEIRMEQAMVRVCQGRVFLPEKADWLSAFESELRAFPGGKHDDQVDALSQAIQFYESYMYHGLYGKNQWPDVA